MLIADDHTLFREGLRRLFEREEDIECVAAVADGAEAVEMAAKLHPKVVLLDISMPKLDGIKAAKRIKSCSPDSAIIMLSQYKLDEYIIASIGVGVSGYLLKDISPKELMQAVHMANAGEAVFDLRAAATTFSRLVASDASRNTCDDNLHAREFDILRLVAQGLTNKGIAKHLAISEHTVRSHLVNVYGKIGVSSRVEATLFAIRKGIVLPGESALGDGDK